MTFHYSLPFEKLIEDAPGTRCSAGPESSSSARATAVASRRCSWPTRRSSRTRPARRDRAGTRPGIRTRRLSERSRGSAVARADGETPLEGNGKEDALFDIRMGEGVDALVGSGLGGTSLINANVAIRPDLDALREVAVATDVSRAHRPRRNGACARQGRALARCERRSQAHHLRKARRVRSAIAAALGIEAKPAPVAVTFALARDNAAGIRQPACTGCGNCVTGCNVGSKNTLAMNVIPAAAKYGAEFYTGALVSCDRAGESCRRSRTCAGESTCDRRRRSLARAVSRAAVHRGRHRHSRGRHARQHRDPEAVGSARLVTCSHASSASSFSTNGDGLAMSFGERDRVNAVGERDYLQPASAPGPTITAMAVRIEDAVRRPLPARGRRDSLAVDRDPRRGDHHGGAVRSPRLEQAPGLVQQPDGGSSRRATRSARPQPGVSGHERRRRCRLAAVQGRSQEIARGAGGIVPHWPDEGESPNPVLARIDRRLAKHDREAGLNGGQYVHNPLWQTLPASSEWTAGQVSGRPPADRASARRLLHGRRLRQRRGRSGRRGVQGPGHGEPGPACTCSTVRSFPARSGIIRS